MKTPSMPLAPVTKTGFPWSTLIAAAQQADDRATVRPCDRATGRSPLLPRGAAGGAAARRRGPAGAFRGSCGTPPVG